jgi:dihydrofolate reductase
MQRTIHIAMSLDGYIAEPDGNFDWLIALARDPKVNERVLAFIAASDLIVMGRKTYTEILNFGEWPHPEKSTIVVSDTLQEASSPDTVITPRDRLFETLAASKAQNIWIVGGGLLNGYMLEQGWVDALIVTVAPILLGQGIPLFAGLSHHWPLQLREVVQLPCGFVELNYVLPRPC